MFTHTKEVGEEGDKKTLTQGVNLDYLVNYVYDESTLFLFMDEQIEAVRVVEVPVKIKPSKENTAGWKIDQQARTVKESYTIEVTDPEAINRFLEYQKQTSI